MDIKQNFKGYLHRFNVRHAVLCLLLFLFVKVSSQDVDVPNIRTLSINRNMVDITWEKSKHPNVIAYEVQYGKYVGNPFPSWSPVITVDSSQNSVSFDPIILIDVDVYEEQVPFAVKAITSASEESRVDGLPWDSTIYLRASFDTCLAQIQLDWTEYDYNMWTYGTREYVIMIRENNGPLYAYDTVSPNTTSYQINDLIANNIYSIYIGAVADTSRNDTSTSKVVEINTGMARLPEYIHADYATYKEGNAEIKFSIDPNGEIPAYELLRSNAVDGEYVAITRLQVENNEVNYVDAVDYNAGPYYYKLEAINFCEESIRTSENVASTILLTRQGEPLMPELQWNEYFNWINGVSYYQVDRKIGNDDFSMLATTNSTDFTDNSLTQSAGTGMSASVCYKIGAFENNNPYGEDAQSYSNHLCFELPVNIRFEYDAFMPGNPSGNNTFGPEMDYVPDEFEFTVVDRGGEVMFKTTDPQNLMWDGKHNGNYVTQGAYMYVVKYKVGSGKRKTIRGGLVVVYP